jgi:hypothetical protein
MTFDPDCQAPEKSGHSVKTFGLFPNLPCEFFLALRYIGFTIKLLNSRLKSRVLFEKR